MRPDGTSSMSNANGFSPLSNGSTATPFRKTALSSPMNGHSPHSVTNGNSHKNGSVQSPSSPVAPSYFGHDREEVTRILIQSLFDLGYEGAATSLCRESGYQLESPAVAEFRSAVIEGRWTDAENILSASRPSDSKSLSHDRNGRYSWEGLVLAEGANRNEMLFCLRQQKYLELLEERDVGSALMVLRQELTPLNHDISQLHALSSLLMCPPEHLRAQSGWEGSVAESRQTLLSELSKSISPSVMIPDHRLAVLLDHVKQNQINQCLYHNTAAAPSLYSDHLCDRSQFPLQTELELHDHIGEVWYVEFSHDGSKLATSGEDRTVYIYDTFTFSILHKLSEHDKPVVCVAWSPDDSKLVSCCRDHKARLWDTTNGRCLLTIDHHNEPVTSAAWTPDGESFVTSSLDAQNQLCLWSVRGHSLHNWPGGYRVQDCAISPDGRHLAAISTERKIYVYNFLTREEEYSISLKVDLTCISISHDSRYLLVNMSDSEVQLLDIETAEVVRRFMGQKQGNFIIRSTFGGAAENFVVSGSEDSRIYIWHKENSTLVETLEGHKFGCVNSVAWNPRWPGMFASAGDDQKIRIWTRGPPTGGTVVRRGRTLSNGHTRTSALRSTYDPTMS